MDARNSVGKGLVFLVLGTVSLFFAPEQLRESALSGLTRIHEPTTQGDPLLDILKEPIHNPGSFHGKTDAELHQQPHKFEPNSDQKENAENGKDDNNNEKKKGNQAGKSASDNKEGENAGKDSTGKADSKGKEGKGTEEGAEGSKKGKDSKDSKDSKASKDSSKSGKEGKEGEKSGKGKEGDSTKSKDSSKGKDSDSTSKSEKEGKEGKDSNQGKSDSQGSKGDEKKSGEEGQDSSSKGKNAEGKSGEAGKEGSKGSKGINHEPIHGEEYEDVTIDDHAGAEHGHVTNPFTGERLPSFIEDYFKRTRKWSTILWLDNTVFWTRVALETALIGTALYFLARPRFQQLQHERSQ
eukprot:TRINITY_DN5938_c0_g1_i1.p1 TRINITY_DN5938_c0_g1~~TRINITY_DN5938_c0_g1_i1.p1  ORF type:complete len:352 (+),score=168.07 TRINITY_DN5938_c0_g1_i1:138-1193(+)